MFRAFFCNQSIQNDIIAAMNMIFEYFLDVVKITGCVFPKLARCKTDVFSEHFIEITAGVKAGFFCNIGK